MTPSESCELCPTISDLSQDFTSQCDMPHTTTPKNNFTICVSPSPRKEHTNAKERKSLLNITNQFLMDSPQEKNHKNQSSGYPSLSPSKQSTKKKLFTSFEECNHLPVDIKNESLRSSSFPESVFLPLESSEPIRKTQSCDYPSAMLPKCISKRSLSDVYADKEITLKHGYTVLTNDWPKNMKKGAGKNKKIKVKNGEYRSISSSNYSRKRVKPLPSSENAISYPTSFFKFCNLSNRDRNIDNQKPVPSSIYSNSSPVPSISNNNKSLDELFHVSDNDCILPICDSTTPIKNISIQTMSLLLQKHNQTNREEDIFGDNLIWLNKVKRCVIIDCRYKYEYFGGHIKGAINIRFKHELRRFFEARCCEDFCRIVIIFHCEFSKNRGPKAAKTFRTFDREKNKYPCLNFPEIYILEGGYRKFYQQHPDLCTPCNFVSMFDERFQTELKKESRKYHQSWDHRTKKRT